MKNITIKEAVYWIAQAWDEANVNSLAKSWKKLLISANNSLPDSTANVTSLDAAVSNRDEALDDITEFDDLFQKMGFNQGDENWLSPQDWLQEDASDPGYQLMTDDEIVTTVLNEQDDTDSEGQREGDGHYRAVRSLGGGGALS